MIPPKIVVTPTPVFLEAAIQQLQEDLSYSVYDTDKPLLEIIYGLAEKNTTTGEPEVFIGSDSGKIEYFSVLPDDRFKSFCFFYESGERLQLEESIYQADLSLIVCFNQKRFDNVPYRIKEKFINVVLSSITAFDESNIEGIRIETRSDKVFSDFNVPEGMSGYLQAPFDGFKIRFKYSTLSSCEPFDTERGQIC